MWRSSYTVEVWKGSYTVEAWVIMVIRCWVSSTVMIPRTRDEKFLHHGSARRVLHRGSIEDSAYTLLGIVHHNDSYIVKRWRSSHTVSEWKRSYAMETWTIMLIRCWVSSTIMILGIREEKFLHHGSAERVLYRRSMDDCANPLFGIKHHKDSYAVKVWRSSYTVEVWNWSYTVEA